MADEIKKDSSQESIKECSTNVCREDIDKDINAANRLMNDNSFKSFVNQFIHRDAVNTIAFICVICVFAYIFAVTFFSADIAKECLRFVDQSLGNLYGILNTIIGFYCGNVYTKAKLNSNEKTK